MAALFPVDPAIGTASIGALMVFALAYVLTAGLRAMSQTGLARGDRKLIARYMAAGIAALMLVGAVIAAGNLRGDAAKRPQALREEFQNSATCAPALASR